MNLKNLKKFVKKAEDAVSPVVATLMLVLVAAGAAVGISVFMGSFQEEAQESLSADVSGDALTIGGSSTVYEFSKRAIPLFEAANPGVTVELSSGGSGAGVQGVGLGLLDIGSASRDIKVEEFSAYPDFDKNGEQDVGADDLVPHTIGYDAVVPMFQAGHCAAEDDITKQTLQAIWLLNGGETADVAATETALGLNPGDLPAATGAGGKYIFADVFSTCTSPATDADAVITLVSRKDTGGTMVVFCEKLLGKEGGCGDKKIAVGATEYPDVVQADLLGNQDAQEKVAEDVQYMGYTSIGGATSDSTVDASKSVEGVEPKEENIRKLLNDPSNAFPGARPLNYVTVGEPVGMAAKYLEFVLLPTYNQEIAEAADFVSFYE